MWILDLLILKTFTTPSNLRLSQILPCFLPVAQNTVNITGTAGQTDSPGKPGQLLTNQSGIQGCKTSLKLLNKVKFQGIQIDNARGTNPIFAAREKPTFSTDPQLSAQTVTRCCHTKSFLGKRQREGCTHRIEGCMCWRQGQKELPRVTHESLRRKNQGHSGEPGQKASKQDNPNIYSPVQTSELSGTAGDNLSLTSTLSKANPLFY